MHIQKLLKIQLKDDLLRELLNLYNQKNIQMNLVIFRTICNKKIKKKIESIRFLKENQINTIDSNKRCCARIWDNHYGSRCKYHRKNNSDLCKHHLNMIKNNGKLIFNRYDEEKPIYNHKNNIIPWFEKPKIEILNDIIQDQSNRLMNHIHRNLSKQRQITPKF